LLSLASSSVEQSLPGDGTAECSAEEGTVEAAMKRLERKGKRRASKKGFMKKTCATNKDEWGAGVSGSLMDNVFRKVCSRSIS